MAVAVISGGAPTTVMEFVVRFAKGTLALVVKSVAEPPARNFTVPAPVMSEAMAEPWFPGSAHRWRSRAGR